MQKLNTIAAQIKATKPELVFIPILIAAQSMGCDLDEALTVADMVCFG